MIDALKFNSLHSLVNLRTSRYALNRLKTKTIVELERTLSLLFLRSREVFGVYEAEALLVLIVAMVGDILVCA